MATPLVLVTSIPRRIPTSLPGRISSATVHQRFGWLIAQAGGIPVMSDAWSVPEALAARVDAVVINGGTDVDPQRYDAERAAGTDEPDRSRDDFEFGLVRAAIDRGTPVLGVCRGMQLVNVAAGGDLIQDVSAVTTMPHYVRERYDVPVHDVELSHGSAVARAFASPTLQVNSIHHQCVGRLGAGLRCTGRAPDGVVEAIEDADARVIGVQWHPEFLNDEKALEQVALFRALLSRCSGLTAISRDLA